MAASIPSAGHVISAYALAVLTVVPSVPGRSEPTIRSELGARARPQVLLTLLVATIGFGGMFAMYGYVAPLVTEEAGRPGSCRSSCWPSGSAASWGRRAAASTMVVLLQLRLMEVAGDAQMLGAALNHSAVNAANAANALGAWLGGLVIAAGYGYRAPSAVGADLAACGLVFLVASALLRRRELAVG